MMPRQDYEERKAARIERYEERAAKANTEAQARFGSHTNETLRAMGGEPVKVGHHSERRHRRLIEKADNDMRKGCEAVDKAEHYERRAESASNSRAISSDDPEALVKLAASIDKAVQSQERMTAANRIVRSKPKNESTPGKIDKLTALGIPAPATLFEGDSKWDIGFAHWQLSNNNANIRRMRQRLDVLRREFAQADEPDKVDDRNGYKIVENRSANRLQMIFDAKPPENVRAILKSSGFRWAPSEGAWQRLLNHSSRYAAERVLREIVALPMKGGA